VAEERDGLQEEIVGDVVILLAGVVAGLLHFSFPSAIFCCHSLRLLIQTTKTQSNSEVSLGWGN